MIQSKPQSKLRAARLRRALMDKHISNRHVSVVVRTWSDIHVMLITFKTTYSIYRKREVLALIEGLPDVQRREVKYSPTLCKTLALHVTTPLQWHRTCKQLRSADDRPIVLGKFRNHTVSLSRNQWGDLVVRMCGHHSYATDDFSCLGRVVAQLAQFVA